MVSFLEEEILTSTNNSSSTLYLSFNKGEDENLNDELTYDIHYVFAQQGDDLNNNDLTRQTWEWSASQNVSGEPIFNNENNCFELKIATNNLSYINWKRLPGVPLDVFFGIKAVDNEGLKSETPKIIYLHLPPLIPEPTT